jgi:hypothetical protein
MKKQQEGAREQRKIIEDRHQVEHQTEKRGKINGKWKGGGELPR